MFIWQIFCFEKVAPQNSRWMKKRGIDIDFFRNWFDDVLFRRPLTRLVVSQRYKSTETSAGKWFTDNNDVDDNNRAKSILRETFLETRFTTIRRTLVKVPSYNTGVSQCGSLRIRWLLAKTWLWGRKTVEEGREERQREAQGATRLDSSEWAFISVYLARMTSPYAGIKERL